MRAWNWFWIVWFSFWMFYLLPILDIVAGSHHGAVEGFFSAPQERADYTSFEGGNKSGASAEVVTSKKKPVRKTNKSTKKLTTRGTKTSKTIRSKAAAKKASHRCAHRRATGKLF
jgi:hypothetical protein